MEFQRVIKTFLEVIGRPAYALWWSALYLQISLAACQPGVGDSLVPTLAKEQSLSTVKPQPPDHEGSPTKITTASSPTATTSLIPEALTLAVPPRWATVAKAAIDQHVQNDQQWEWKLEAVERPADDLAQGKAQVALIPGSDGVYAGQRPLVLAVPITSEWEAMTLTEAQKVVAEGSPFIGVMDWSEMPPTHKALRIDGRRPSDLGYPLHQPWSLITASGFEPAASELARHLAPNLTKEPLVHLVAVGDVMLDRALGEVIRTGDILYPFAEVVGILGMADIAVGNLESALGETGSPANKGYVFRAPPEAAQSLALAGFDLLSLANNHALDYGGQSLLEGINLLQEAGISTVGAGIDQIAAHQPHVRQINGLTMAFLAYVHVPVEVRGFDTQTWTADANRPGVAWADPAQIRSDITAIRPDVDLVVVLLHSGYESVLDPSPPQIAAAQAAVDAGADLVIGHHAHVLQGVQFYNDGVITYGLGNFAFQDGGPPESVILNVWLDEDGVRQLEFTPVILEPDGHPRLATETEATIIHQQIYQLTQAQN